MDYLRNVPIQGQSDAVATVVEHFGEVYLGGPIDAKALHLTIMKVLPNFYRDSNARQSGSPLYIVVPNMPIENVWPPMEGIDSIKYGTATDGEGIICSAIALHKGVIGLYLCLSPAGQRIADIGSLGI